MSAKMQLSFKEYFIYEFMERVLQKVNEVNDIQVQKYLTDFVNAIRTSGDFFEGIETLAQYPGTSDLSIFFADILENLSIYSPDEVHTKLDELSHDLIEMFKLLKNDEVWIESLDKFKAEVGGVYAYVPETTAETMTLTEFCEFWLKNRFNELFDSIVKEDKNKELGKQIFQSLIVRDSIQELLELTENSTLGTILEQYEAILEFKKGSTDEHFIANFYQMVDGFYDDLIQFIDEKPHEVEVFLQKLSELQLQEMEEKAKSLEQKVQQTRFTQTKDVQLEGVLSEYLTKEFHETLNDIIDIINELQQNESESLWNEFSDNASYLMEMGSIHQVPFLENLGESLKNLINETRKMNLDIEHQLGKNLIDFLTELKDQLKDFSEIKQQDIIDLIQNKFAELRNTVTELAIAKNIEEDKYTLHENFAKVVSAFDLTHQYYWQLISREYARWLSHKDRAKEAANLSQWLQHLYFWYENLGFSHVLKALQYLNQIFLTLKYGEVSTALDAYIQEFLMTMPESPTDLMKEKIDDFVTKIQSEGIELGESKYDFVNVKSQIYKFLTNVLSKEFLMVKDAAYMLDKIEGFLNRFKLMGENELISLLERFKSIVEENYEIWKEEEFNSRITKTLTEFVEKINNREFIDGSRVLDLLNDMILSYKFEKDMKQTSPTITLVEEETEFEPEMETEETELGKGKDKEHLSEETVVEEDELEELFQAEIEEEKEEIPVQEEEISDEDLHQLFVKEGEKYVQLIQDGIARLRQNPDDLEGKELIYKNAHALKGSSKMMGYEAIGKACEKVENLFEKIISSKKSVDSGLLDEIEKLFSVLLESQPDEEQINNFLELWVDKLQLEEKEPTDEIEYVVLSEQDQDLLQIFEEEAGDVIKQLKGISKYLHEFAMEQKILMELDQALHKIDSAAKMLGFEEIANIVDKINGILESNDLKDEKEVKQFAAILADSTEIISKLAKEKKIEKNKYEQLQQSLEKFLRGEYEAEETEEETIIQLQKKLSEKASEVEAGEPAKELVEEKEAEEKKEVREDVIQLFVNEVNTTLEQIRETLVELELYPNDPEKTYQLFRLMHTLKGAASMVNMEKLQQLAHKFEDVLELYHTEKRALPVVMMSLIQKGIEEVEFMVHNISQKKKELTSAQYPVLISNLASLEQGFRKTESEIVSTPDVSEKDEELKSSLKNQEIVKIPISKLDDLLNNSVELVVTNNELVGFINKLTNEVKRLENERKELTELKSLSRDIFQHYIEIYELTKKLTPQKNHGVEQSELIRPSLENLMNKLENLYMEIKTLENGIKNTLKDFELNFEKTNKISNRLYDYILQVRMVPISMLFDLFPRAVDEIAKKHNKKIKLEIEGGETELDRSMVEHLFEPLLHIIRNAIDHGIETVAERKKLGKPEEGRIKLAAKQEKDHVVITLSDDGQGINFDKIREKAIEKGLISKEDYEKMDENELLRFLFQPGFSTSDQISEISGRGVGLDVVERQIRRLKGELHVETEEGKGTTFIMKFPITLSVSQCILIRIGENSFGIPIYNVEKTFEVKGSEIHAGANYYECEKNGKRYELIYLNELMNLGTLNLEDVDTKNHSFTVVVLRGRMNDVGLLVDRIEKRAELIVKPLGHILQRFPYISGGAILPDASIALILDIDEIIEKFVLERSMDSDARQRKNSVVLLKRITKKNKIGYKDKPKILLIDDSESVREYMKKFINEIGYDLITFGTVEEAREYLEESIPDLIIVDLELPEISGYEFILNLGKEEKWKNIPFMFFTGKKVEMIENLAKDLDALGYILKPFDEQEFIKKFSKLFVPIEK